MACNGNPVRFCGCGNFGSVPRKNSGPACRDFRKNNPPYTSTACDRSSFLSCVRRISVVFPDRNVLSGGRVCGVLFILLIFNKIGGLAESPLQVVAAVLMIACSGSLQLFFGYPESYGMSTLFIAAYVLVSLKFLGSHKPFVLPCLMFSLAVSAHLISIALLPSLIWLYTEYFKACGSSRSIRTIQAPWTSSPLLQDNNVMFK